MLLFLKYEYEGLNWKMFKLCCFEHFHFSTDVIYKKVTNTGLFWDKFKVLSQLRMNPFFLSAGLRSGWTNYKEEGVFY